METITSTTHFGLTTEQFNRFRSACHTTRSYLSEELPSYISQAELIETVLDADRVFTLGCSHTDDHAAWETFYTKVMEPIISKNYGTPEFLAMMNDIFPSRPKPKKTPYRC